MHVGFRQTSTGALSQSRRWPRARDPRRAASRAHLLLGRRNARPSSCATSDPPTPTRLSPAEWRSATETVAAAARRRQASCATIAGRLRASEEGAAAVARFLGEKEAHARAWSEQRDIWLVAKALGADAGKPAIRKALTRPEGLSALIVQEAFGLSTRQALSPPKLQGRARAAGARARVRRHREERTAERLGALGAGRPRARRPAACRARASSPPTASSSPRSPPSRREPRAPRWRRCASALLRRLAGQARSGTAAPKLVPTTKAPRRSGATASFAARGSCRAAASWTGAIFRRCAQRGTHPCRGLARQSQGVYLSGVESDSHIASGVGSLRDRVQGHAGRRSPGGSAGAFERRPQEQAEHQASSRTSAILYKNTVWHFVRVED